MLPHHPPREEAGLNPCGKGRSCSSPSHMAGRFSKTAMAESGARVTHDPLPAVRANGRHLAQLFQNLLGNSIKFHASEPPQIHVAAQRLPSEWVFSVQENGIGIEPQYADRIFEVFQRLHTRSEYPGSESAWPSPRKSWNATGDGSGSPPSFTRGRHSSSPCRLDATWPGDGCSHSRPPICQPCGAGNGRPATLEFSELPGLLKSNLTPAEELLQVPSRPGRSSCCGAWFEDST